MPNRRIAGHRRRLRPWCDPLEPRALLSAVGVGELVGPVVAGGLAAQVRPATGSTVVRNIVYTTRGGQAEALDVYLPRGSAPAGGWPVVLAIHGGGWRQYDRSEYAAKVAGPLLGAGFAVVAPDYALSSPGVPSWPLAYNDVRDAVSWIHSAGGSYGLNAIRVAAMGESAGAHLAAMLGTEPDPATRVRAVVDFFGPADLAAMVDGRSLGAPEVEQFLGTTPAVNPAVYAAASPVDRVTAQSAPILIYQGTADPIVPASQSEELAAAYTAAGVPNHLILIPGASHGFGLQVGRRNLLPQVVTFLRSELV